ncbi:hypothetical protein BCE02nite_49250 [Brevibacillus centrosporus]|nr:hypothetical protein BCE02nite_49250 [Brevibacillus centrosporus]
MYKQRIYFRPVAPSPHSHQQLLIPHPHSPKSDGPYGKDKRPCYPAPCLPDRSGLPLVAQTKRQKRKGKLVGNLALSPVTASGYHQQS